jgi:YVTN family beta-propeller protein
MNFEIKLKVLLLTYFMFYAMISFEQINHEKIKTTNYDKQLDKLPIEDSTLIGNTYPIILPYNRLIDASGVSIHFGDPTLENHSLDVKLMPDKKSVVVEDRYGIAIFDINTHKKLARFSFNNSKIYKDVLSTFSGIKVIKHHDSTFLFWSAAKTSGLVWSPSQGDIAQSFVMQMYWDGHNLKPIKQIPFSAINGAENALPNELEVCVENDLLVIYVVLNGNNTLQKIRLCDNFNFWTTSTGVAPYGITIVKNLAYITNWAGSIPSSNTKLETAGVPWGAAYVNPTTGAISSGSVSIIDINTGKLIKELNVGLHPNAIIHSPDEQFVYVSNGNSDNISVIKVANNEVIDSIQVSVFQFSHNYIGSSPNALTMNLNGSKLYVANGMDNAITVININNESNKPKFKLDGFIPTEAYPSGIVNTGKLLIVTNLEGIGARVNNKKIKLEEYPDIEYTKHKNAYTSHNQLASVSFIPIPSDKDLYEFSKKVRKQNLVFREELSRQLPRPNIVPKPMPERIGEPSLFNHVLYIIKENRTYDQVFGDILTGRGDSSLCIYGNEVTPNQHQLVKDFCLLDNLYVSGKSSAEGHQWTDASMVTDYIEKNVRGWFRSYPHAQYDAMVYDKNGFIWNNALDHGKTVKIYGEACKTKISAELNWTKIYNLLQKNLTLDCENVTTISRVAPILSQRFPGYDDRRINDQLRANAFIADLNEASQQVEDTWPNLMIMSLPNDHTAGITPEYPTPRAMVADNDLALGRIVEAVTKSKFWSSTVIFVIEDDSQEGWDHISAYRNIGMVLSPYSLLNKTIHTQYNTTSVVRSIEQILGLPPMNGLDATALPMFDCFEKNKNDSYTYKFIPNKIALNEMNSPISKLNGKALSLAKKSIKGKYDKTDMGDDDELNKILWFSAKGNRPYPSKFSKKDIN